MSTEDLQSIKGIGVKTAEQLIQAGIQTPVALATCNIQKLIAIGIPKAKAIDYVNKARERCGALFGFVTGEELIQQFKRRQYLTTGTKGLDRILGGKGFETQKVYEIYGPEGTGKSTLLHQLACTAFLPPDKGGLGASTIYVDAEGSFSLNRLQEMAPRFGLDPDELARNVTKAAPPNSDILLYICEVELPKMTQQTGARLFCLDSIATHFRTEYGSERQLVPERQQKAGKIIHALKRIAQVTNGVAILTNQATGNVDAKGKFDRKWFHAMGLLIGHESQVRIVTKPKSIPNKTFTLKIEKALDLPPNECVLKMDTQGFKDEFDQEPKEEGAPKSLPLKKKRQGTRRSRAKEGEAESIEDDAEELEDSESDNDEKDSAEDAAKE